MDTLRNTTPLILAYGCLLFLALFLSGCSNTKQHTDQIAAMEKEKSKLESRLRELENAQQQAIASKDSEIVRLTELNKSLETQVKELQKQANRLPYPSNPVVVQQPRQPSPQYTFDQLKSAVLYKSKEEVQRILGNPDRVDEFSDGRQAWTYKDVAYDALTGRVSSFTTIYFSKTMGYAERISF